MRGFLLANLGIFVYLFPIYVFFEVLLILFCAMDFFENVLKAFSAEQCICLLNFTYTVRNFVDFGL